jgi:hypothetical protein
MSAPRLPSAVPWGDRSQLIPKHMLYAVSLDVETEANGPYLVVRPTSEKALRHLYDETTVTMPEGLRCDVPTAKILNGDGDLASPYDPSSTSLRIGISAQLEDGNVLNIACEGVLSFEGGPLALRSMPPSGLSGSAFIATTHDTLSATYRWLRRRQLFGVGTVEARQISGVRLLAFSFDLYAAA